MGVLCIGLVAVVAAAQGAGAASRPTSRPGARPTGTVVRVESAPAIAESRPESRSEPRPESRSVSKLAAILARSDADPNFEIDGLERAIVPYGRGVLPELDKELRARAATPAGPPLARAYGKLALEKAIPTLHELGRSKEDDARYAAARGLETISHRSAVDELLLLLDDERAVVERAAQDSLVSLEKAKVKIGVRGALEKRLASTSLGESSRSRAARCLSRIADGDSLRVLLAGLDDRSPDVRAACVEALGHIPATAHEATPPLLKRLEDVDIEVRRQTILALGRLRAREACPELIELLDEEDRSLQSNAHWALRAISGHAFPNSAERWKDWWKHELARIEAEKAKKEAEDDDDEKPDDKNP